MLRSVLPLLLCLLTTVGLSAQKIAHVNFGNLLNELPETTAADSQLDALNKQLTKKGEQMVASFRSDLEAFQTDVPTLAPVDRQARQQKLEADQLAIQDFEQQMVVDIETKRRELLAPIIDRAKAAIARIAQAQGFQLVVDSSVFNSVLYADDAVDLTEAVRKEMGGE